MQDLYGITLRIIYPAIGSDLSFSDLSKIKDRIVVPKQPITIITPSASVVTSEIPKATFATQLEELIEGYEKLEKDAGNLGDMLQDRISEKLNMPITPQDPDVYEAAHQLFKGLVPSISFAMYRKLLTYAQLLGRSLVEAEA